MSDGGRVIRERASCVEWSIDEYNSKGGFTSTTIRIETCGSDAGSSRRSSRKTTSTMRHRRRKKTQQQQQKPMWFATAEEDFFPHTSTSSHHYQHPSGRARCGLKAPFSSGTAGAPYNKKLHKKKMQQQQRCDPRFSLREPTRTNTMNTNNTTRRPAVDVTSCLFISPTHRAVAEETTPWNTTTTGPPSTCYQFFGHGGLPTSILRTEATHQSSDDDENNEDDNPPLLRLRRGERVRPGGGSRVLAPVRSPSLLPSLHFLPASKAEVSMDLLEQRLLEATLDDSDGFSLL